MAETWVINASPLDQHATRDAPFHRLTVEPTPENGLQVVTRVMVDKIMAARCDRCGTPIGKLDDTAILVISRMLALVVGLAD